MPARSPCLTVTSTVSAKTDGVSTAARADAVTASCALWTIGHSTHPWDEFLALLHTNGIETVADVRTLPGSRKFPQFDQDTMAAALASDGIDYQWLPALGGRRKMRANSPNDAWRNASFRGYADHMASAEFGQGMAQLLALASTRRTAIMCAEAVWWRCHRGLIADALLMRGCTVAHIMGSPPARPHPWTSAAHIVDGKLSYAAAPDD